MTLISSSIDNLRYILSDSDALKYSNTAVYAWNNNSYSAQNAYTTDCYTPPKNHSYKEGYLDAASHYKYELKMLLNAIERADITVGCNPDKFQLAIDRARKAADEPLNQIQPEEEVF